MSVCSSLTRWLIAAIFLSCLLTEVHPREIGHKGNDKREYAGVFTRKHAPLKSIYERYVADLAKLELKSVRERRNYPPMIEVRTLHGGKHPAVKENVRPGELVAFVDVTDPDDERDGEFDCWVDNDKFELVKVYAGQYKVVTRSRLDYESSTEYTMGLTCADHGHNKQVTTKAVRIAVVDVNDNPPIFTRSIYEARILENNRRGTFLLKVHAEDRDSGQNGRVRYRLRGSAGDYLTINKDTGYIFAKGVFDYEKTPKLTLGVMASDYGRPPITSYSQVTLNIIDDDDF